MKRVKAMKRILALALAVVVVLTMNMTVFADNEGTTPTYAITITNEETGHTYEAYQIFKGDLSSAGVLSNIEWGAGVTDAGKLALGNAADKAKSLENASAATVREFAEKMNGYLGTPSISVNTATTKNEYKMDGLEAGYYLIKDKDASMDEQDGSYTSFILQVTNKNQVVNAKADKPTVVKKVMDINDSTGAVTDWQDSADYDIGDDVPFQLTATLPNNVDKYDTYQIVFHDTLSAGFTYNTDLAVYMDGVNVTSEFDSDVVSTDAGTALTFSCDDMIALGAKNGSKVVITYTAELDEDAVIGAAGNPNKVYLEFSNNPNHEGEGTGKTPEDKVIVFTYKVDINKFDENEKSLEGAAFQLEKLIKGTEGKEDQWVLVKEYKVAAGQTTFEFKGIDDGTYRLTETVTPQGYNTIDPIEFIVKAEHKETSDDPMLITLIGNKTNGDVFVIPETIEGTDTPTGTMSANVINHSGSTLPSTGGTGRVLLYTVGAILVVVAGIVLVAKKRAAK